MAKNDRRDFLRSSGMAAAALGYGSGPAVGESTKEAGDASDRGPDLALLNGVIYTVDERLPKVEAFAVRHGRFVARIAARLVSPRKKGVLPLYRHGRLSVHD